MVELKERNGRLWRVTESLLSLVDFVVLAWRLFMGLGAVRNGLDGAQESPLLLPPVRDEFEFKLGWFRMKGTGTSVYHLSIESLQIVGWCWMYLFVSLWMRYFLHFTSLPFCILLQGICGCLGSPKVLFQKELKEKLEMFDEPQVLRIVRRHMLQHINTEELKKAGRKLWVKAVTLVLKCFKSLQLPMGAPKLQRG